MAQATDPHINPATGVWDDNYFAQQQKASGGASGGGGTGLNPSEWTAQALSFLQPSINNQIQPIQQAQSLLPSIYSQQQTALQNEKTGTANYYNQLIKGIQDQSATTKEQINEQTVNQLGQQRANEAAMGFASTSGVEQSQEKSISDQTAMRLQQLDQATSDQTLTLGIQSANQQQQIADQIAQLPNQQAMQSLQYGMQIAQIQGQGAQAAIQYGAQMAQFQAQLNYQQFQESMADKNLQLAQDKLAEAIQHDRASEAIAKIGAGAAATSASAAATNAQTGQQRLQLQANPPTKTTTTQSQFNILNPSTWFHPGTTSTTSVGNQSDPIGIMGNSSDPLGLNSNNNSSINGLKPQF